MQKSINDEYILNVEDLKKHFPILSPLGKEIGKVQAVNQVDFKIKKKQTLGVVGESGCGKSTMGRTLLRLIDPTDGRAYYKGRDIFSLNRAELKEFRKSFQMVFQDPHSSINPQQRVGKAIEEPMKIHNLYNKNERMEVAMDLLEKVGLRSDYYFRYPHEFSGGQRQRIGIARALSLNPEVIVCDEPVSALDVSIQSQVINLLKELQEMYELTYIFIAHDLSVVRYVADEIAVMYLGHIVEKSETDELFKNPLHPYTKALFSSIPRIDQGKKKERIILEGNIPSPINPPKGCKFHTRCPFAMEICKREEPKFEYVDSSSHKVACHLYSN